MSSIKRHVNKHLPDANPLPFPKFVTSISFPSFFKLSHASKPIDYIKSKRLTANYYFHLGGLRFWIRFFPSLLGRSLSQWLVKFILHSPTREHASMPLTMLATFNFFLWHCSCTLISSHLGPGPLIPCHKKSPKIGPSMSVPLSTGSHCHRHISIN